ncbi:histidine triad nucleotide-binding protein [Elusimicrobiota bacterium]
MEKNCIFCRLAKGEIPAEVVYSNDKVVAFRDINPQAPFHVLICSREHVSSLSEAEDSHRELLGELQLAAKNLANELKLDSFRLILNNGAHAGQTVFHIHYHLLGGRRFNWPPG